VFLLRKFWIYEFLLLLKWKSSWLIPLRGKRSAITGLEKIQSAYDSVTVVFDLSIIGTFLGKPQAFMRIPRKKLMFPSRSYFLCIQLKHQGWPNIFPFCLIISELTIESMISYQQFSMYEWQDFLCTYLTFTLFTLFSYY
jgi:hypothetical protein